MILIPTHLANVYLNVRENSPDDFNVIREIWCEDIYHINDRLHDAKFVVDVGANIGAFTCYILERSHAKVLAIEPEENNLELLKMNIARLDPKRATISTYAVSDYEGESMISNKAGGSRLILKGLKGQTVSVTTIDKLLADYKDDIDIFKVDIEGCEVPLIMSMSMELQQRVKFFAIEFDDTSKGYGDMVEKLSETHKLTTMGAASNGGMIYGERYD